MSYLIFIFAAGLFALLGAGGLLHRDAWFDALNRRLDAIDLDLLPGLMLRVGAPLLAAGMLLVATRPVIGGAAEALIGASLLYFAWGRGDYPTDLERFLARARVGDTQGARALLSQLGARQTQDEEQSSLAMRYFLFRGFSRWFPPVLYFWLLGPFAAAGYRLVALVNSRCDGQLDSVQHALDWLPARALLLTFAVLGDFERTRGLLTADAFDSDVANEELLARGVRRAWQLGNVDGPEDTVREIETVRKAVNRATVVWVVLASFAVLV